MNPTRSVVFEATVPSGNGVYRDPLTMLVGQRANQTTGRGAALMYDPTLPVEGTRSPPRLNERRWRRTFGLDPSSATIPVRRFADRVAEWTRRRTQRGLQ